MRLLAYLQLIRAPNGITAITNILAATFLVSADQIDYSSAVLLCLASLCLYYAGMIFNDCFDFKEDMAERPSRPLPSGKIPINIAWALGIFLAANGIGFAFLVSLESMVIAIILSASILAYDGLIKSGLAGAFTMASCRYFNWLLGLSLAPLGPHSYLVPLPIFFYIAALTYLSKQETKAEDPGALKTVSVLLLLSLLSLGYLLHSYFEFSWIAIIASAIFSGVLVWRLFQSLRHFTPQNVQATVVMMIIGIIPFDALLAVCAKDYLIALLIILLILPTRYLSKRLSMT